MNHVVLVGRLTKDVELRYTPSNKACATFSIAVNNGKDSDGNERPADFINVVAWENVAENLNRYTHKGDMIAITGSLKNESWEDSQGNKKYRTYVLARKTTFITSKKESTPLPQEPDYLKNETKERVQDPFESFGDSIEIADNDLPF